MTRFIPTRVGSILTDAMRVALVGGSSPHAWGAYFLNRLVELADQACEQCGAELPDVPGGPKTSDLPKS